MHNICISKAQGASLYEDNSMSQRKQSPILCEKPYSTLPLLPNQPNCLNEPLGNQAIEEKLRGSINNYDLHQIFPKTVLVKESSEQQRNREGTRETRKPHAKKPSQNQIQ